ncbi:hypothetical protein GGH96_002577 [Coemansia sp. RSA 1972]|nr:hypothetical protein GGH96_002577 [Coemansia sp. RSA 1972]
MDKRDTLRQPTDEWNDLDAPSDFDASSKAKRRGTRGRGRRINYVKKAVFQPSVRVVPLGMNERMGESGRGRAETKIGRAGLVLVNRRAVGSGREPSVSDSCDGVHVPKEESTSENPWARRSQSHARHVATAQQTDTHGMLPACDVETFAVNGDSVAKEPEQCILDREDNIVRTDEMEQRLRDQMEAHVATAEHTRSVPVISSAVSSETESSCEQADVISTAVPVSSVDTVPTTLAPSTDVAADTAEAWGTRTKATGSEPTPEQPKSRWWKASLTGGSRRVDSALKPMPRNPIAMQKPEPKPDDARARGKVVRTRRGQAPIPTVVPPLVLARATIRSTEQRPVSDISRAHSLDLAAVAVDEPVLSAERLSEPAETAVVEPIALEEPCAEPLPVIKLDAEPVKKRVSIDVPMQAESWRVPLSLAKTSSVETLGKSGSAVQRQSSTGRIPRPPPKQSERRERGRAATNSMAAMSTNWRVNRPTSTTDTALASDISRPSTAFTLGAPWSDTESLPQNGHVAERQRSHTQLRPSQAYYGSIPDMTSLLQISAPLSSTSMYPANSGSRALSSPPPLLPPVLADILSDGEPARSVSLQTSVPSSSSSLASAVHNRARRISSVIGAVPASKPDTLAFVSRGRSSSLLFHGANGLDVVRPLAQPDQGLFLWRPDPAQGSTSMHNVQGATSAEPVWGMPTRALRPLHSDHPVFGMSQAPTFSAFSSGASMLWAEPVPPVDSRVVYGPNVSHVRDNAQMGRTPRPIGTRSTPAVNGVRSAQQNQEYSSVQKPRSDYHNAQAPHLEYQGAPWQMHYSPLQLPPVYSTMQAAVPDSYAHVPANAAPYMVPVSDPSMHIMASHARADQYPVHFDAFGNSGLYHNVQYANGHIRPPSPMYRGVTHGQPYAQYYSAPMHGAVQPLPVYMEAQMGQPIHAGAHMEQWTSAPHVGYAQPVHSVESRETVQQVPGPVDVVPSVSSVQGQNARGRKPRDRPRNTKNERKQPVVDADDSTSRRKAQTDRTKKSDEGPDKAQSPRRSRANRKPGRKREPNDSLAK